MTGIRKLIQQLSDNGDEVYAKVALVYQISEQDRTCNVSPLDGSAHVYNVRLQATPQLNDGLVVFPKLNSQVVIVFLNKNQAFVALCSEVDRVELRGGSLGGLVKVGELVTKLNNLEKTFNNHIQNYNTHVHTGVTAGVGLSGIPSVVDSQVMAETQRIELENDTVKHG